jgi:hypothetical protein
VSASVAGASAGIAGLGAGTETATSGTVVFVDSGGISFGMSGSTQITGDVGAVRTVSANGTSLGNIKELVFVDSNGVTFGLSTAGSTGTITASVAAGGGTATGNLGGLAAGTQTGTSGTIAFVNSNGVTFGMSGSTRITASVAAETATGNLGGLAAGTQTATSGTVAFVNSNNVSFGMSGSTQVTASFSETGTGNLGGLAAGTQTATSGTVAFVNSNNVSFGMSGSTQITASFSETGTGNIGGLAAGTQTGTSGTIAFVNSNGISFGMSNSTQITASYTQSTAPAAIAAGTQTGTSGTIAFVNSNNVSFGMSGSTQVTASFSETATGNLGGIAAGTQTGTSGTIVFSNSNGVTFGMSNNSVITASVSVTASAAAMVGTFYDNAPGGALSNLSSFNMGGNAGRIFVQPLRDLDDLWPFDITASSFMLDISQSGSTATMSQAFTTSIFVGIYTVTDATLSLLNSVSMSFGSGADNANLSTQVAGLRYAVFQSSAWSSSPVFRQGSQYFFAYMYLSSSISNQTEQWIGYFRQVSQQRSGTIGVSQPTGTGIGFSVGGDPFVGSYSTTSGAIPASIANTQLAKAGNSPDMFVPHVVMNANTAIASF